MRVAVLHQHVPSDAAPDERDVLDEVQAVAEALAALGHEPVVWPCDLDLSALERRLASVDMAFNLVETLGGSGRLGHLVPGVLEARGARYTGNTSTALMLTAHKPLTKRILAAAGVPVAPSHHETAGRCIVKPIWEDASLGIDDDAVVPSGAAAAARLAERGRDWFAEAYIPGREINVAIMDGPASDPRGRVQVLPVAEIVFDGVWAPEKPRIIGYAAKWDPSSFEYQSTRRVFPAGEEALMTRIADIARRCWDALELSGYARVDFRVTEDGQPIVLEVNANPCVSPDSGFTACVEAAGLGYRDAVARIVEAGLSRGSR